MLASAEKSLWTGQTGKKKLQHEIILIMCIQQTCIKTNFLLHIKQQEWDVYLLEQVSVVYKNSAAPQAVLYFDQFQVE